MANWKKLVVSGSDISQLNNDAGYLTAGTLEQANGFSTASFDGVNLLADSITGSLNFASSSNQGLTISANAGTDTLTFGLSAIPNASLANSSITIGSTNIALGATATTLAGLTSITSTSFTGSFTGSFAGDGSQLTGIVATATSLANAITGGLGIVPFVYTNIAPVTVAVSGAIDLTDNAITKWDTADGKFQNSSLTDNGTVISGVSSIQLSGANSSLTGSFTGSFTGDGSGLTGLPTTLNFGGDSGASSVNLLTQTLAISGSANEVVTSVSGQTVTIGLPDDVIIGRDLTVTRNLTVFGTASFQNTENLLVADRFVLLASGSTTDGPGGIVVQQDTQNIGELFGWDSGADRWAVTGSFVANQSAFTPDAFMAAAINLAGTNPNTTSPDTKYNKKGNIYVSTANEDIWIYS
jgi:hypothetical protein